MQHAGVAALADGARTVAEARAAYARRRALLVAGLRTLGFGIAARAARARSTCSPMRARSAPTRAASRSRCSSARTSPCTPGIDFGAAGEGFLRFCYAASEADIAEALARMQPVLQAMRGAWR